MPPIFWRFRLGVLHLPETWLLVIMLWAWCSSSFLSILHYRCHPRELKVSRWADGTRIAGAIFGKIVRQKRQGTTDHQTASIHRIQTHRTLGEKTFGGTKATLY